jgi:hypothetical protein
MQQIIEILGANIIGALILLIGITLNLQINSASRDVFEDTYLLRNSITSFQVMEYDISKAGCNVTGEKIILADSNALKFNADVSNNDVVKTVYYYMSSDTAMSTTPNPNDRQLLRKIDDGNPNLVTIITNLKFSYYDSTGSFLTYASLSSSAGRSLIRSIQANVRIETANPVDTIYKPIEWKTIIRPRNLL